MTVANMGATSVPRGRIGGVGGVFPAGLPPCLPRRGGRPGALGVGETGKTVPRPKHATMRLCGRSARGDLHGFFGTGLAFAQIALV